VSVSDHSPTVTTPPHADGEIRADRLTAHVSPPKIAFQWSAKPSHTANCRETRCWRNGSRLQSRGCEAAVSVVSQSNEIARMAWRPRLLGQYLYFLMSQLVQIQRRRSFPTRLTQRMQGIIQKQNWRGLGKSERVRLPWPLRLLERTTLPCRMRTRFISVGFRPEHVKTRDVYK
jgi:hypothetical protein